MRKPTNMIFKISKKQENMLRHSSQLMVF